MDIEVDLPSFTPKYVKTIGINNNADNGRGFAYPYDLKVNSDGLIFVMNRWSKAPRVGVCNLDEDYIYEFGEGYGSDDGQFTLPVSLAFDSEERLYVTDEYLHRVSIFSAGGEFLNKWGTNGSGAGELDGPAGIVCDDDDNVYIVDQKNHRVQKFTREGQFLNKWGTHGNGQSEFNMPWGIALDSHGNVYVSDWRNDRIQKFTSNGEFITSFGETGNADGQLNRPAGVAVDGSGYVYIADWKNERVQVFAPDGSFVIKLRGEATLSQWSKEFLDANPDEKELREKSNLLPTLPTNIKDPYYVSSQTEPYFWGPVSVTIDFNGLLYVTESNRHRFQVYQLPPTS